MICASVLDDWRPEMAGGGRAGRDWAKTRGHSGNLRKDQYNTPHQVWKEWLARIFHIICTIYNINFFYRRKFINFRPLSPIIGLPSPVARRHPLLVSQCPLNFSFLFTFVQKHIHTRMVLYMYEWWGVQEDGIMYEQWEEDDGRSKESELPNEKDEWILWVSIKRN